MIRVLQIGMSNNFGGIESFVINLYRNIDRKEIQFDFIDFTKNGICFKEEIEKMGGKIYKVTPRNKSIRKNIKELKEIIKNNNYKVIHFHLNTLSYITPIIIAQKLRNVKIIVHSHSQWKGANLKTILLDKMNRLRFKKKNIICLACSDVAGRWMFKNNNFKIINNGIDLDKFITVTDNKKEILKNELKIQKNDFVIGHIGSFIEVKNQEFFIDFAKELEKKSKDFKIILVGDGKRKKHIEELIEQNNLTQYFIFLGVRYDVNIIVNIFDIFIMPSLFEGFPLAVVEALAGNNICYLSENISKETNIIEERVKYFNLNDDIKILIDRILEDRKSKKNVNIEDVLIDKGFSIKNTAKNITNIYLN